MGNCILCGLPLGGATTWVNNADPSCGGAHLECVNAHHGRVVCVLCGELVRRDLGAPGACFHLTGPAHVECVKEQA